MLALMQTYNEERATPESMSAPNNLQSDKSDEEFLKHLNNLYENGPSSEDTLEESEELEVDDDIPEEEKDQPDINHYLPNKSTTRIS